MSAPNVRTDPTQAWRDFIKTIHGEAAGLIDLRAIAADAGVVETKCQSLEEATAFISKHPDRNIYYGVATRDKLPSDCPKGVAPGGKANLRGVSALWCDIDLDGDKRTRESAEKNLAAFPRPPSYVLWSGGGFHVYWLLEEPLDVSKREAVQRVEDAVLGITEKLEGDLKTWNADRILRIPATTNYPDAKKRARGRVVADCVVMQPDNGNRYDFDDFDVFEMRGAEMRTTKSEPKSYDREAWNGELPEAVRAVLEEKGPREKPRWPKFVKRWGGDVIGLNDESDSAIDLAVANHLADALGHTRNLEDEDQCNEVANLVEQALRIRRNEAGAKTKHASYYTNTVGLSLVYAQEQRRKRGEEGSSDPTPPDSKAPSRFEDGTDDGNAERLVRLHGEDLRFVPLWKRWLVWDGTRFKQDEGTEARARMRATVRSLIHEAAEERDEDRQSALLRQAKGSRAMSRMRAALWIAESDAHVVVHPSALDREPWLLNVRNGTLDLRTGELREHRRSDALTALAPVAYDPSAKAPRWLAFLERIQPDAEMRAFLQRAAGYSLTGSTKEDCAFIAYGRGANGKSTFLETVRAIIGEDYSAELAANALTMRARNDDLERLVAPLPGKRLVTTLELAEGQRLHEQAVKRMTSGEPMRARFLFGESFEFTPVGKVWMATNHRPAITGADDGIWRRLRLVPFDEQIPEAERDHGLRERLLAEEAPGILRWLMEGCLAWQKKKLCAPESVTDATANYRASEDVVGAFIAEWCNTGPGERAKAGDLKKALDLWCKQNGEDDPPTSKALASRLEQRGFTRNRNRGGSVWRGLNLTEEARKQLTIASR